MLVRTDGLPGPYTPKPGEWFTSGDDPAPRFCVKPLRFGHAPYRPDEVVVYVTPGGDGHFCLKDGTLFRPLKLRDGELVLVPG